MTDEEVLNKIKSYMTNMFGIEEEKLSNSNVELVSGLGLDSIDIIDILSQLKEDLALDLYPQDFEGCASLSQFVSVIFNKHKHG